MDSNTKRYSEGKGQRLFVFLVMCLLIASANLGLVNNVLAIKASHGGNLFGVRDVLIVVVLAVGTLRASSRRGQTLVNPLSRLVLLIVLLTPLAMLIGLSNNGQLLSVSREGFMMMGWLLAAVLAANLRDKKTLSIVVNAMIGIGLLVAVGVFVEAGSFGQIRVVTPADVVSISRRSTPSGWPFMMISSSLAQVLFLMQSKSSTKNRLYWLLCWVVIMIASLLTQSRTFVVGIAVSTVVFLIFSLQARSYKIELARIVPFLAVIPIAMVITFTIGNLLIRPDFTDYFVTRYSVLEDLNSMIEYSERDTRRAEIEIGFERYKESPWFGVGLGTTYREAVFSTFDRADPATTIHNIFAFFLFRYGPLGLVVFLLLIYRVLQSLSTALRDTSSGISVLGVGLSVGIVNLFACAVFGNVFGTTYGIPQSMTALGCLIAYERIRDSQRDGDGEFYRTRRSGSPAKFRSYTNRSSWL